MFLDDPLYYTLLSNRLKKVNIFIQKNEMHLKDHFFAIAPIETSEYFSVKNIREYEDKYEDNEGELLAVYLRVDNEA